MKSKRDDVGFYNSYGNDSQFIKYIESSCKGVSTTVRE